MLGISQHNYEFQASCAILEFRKIASFQFFKQWVLPSPRSTSTSLPVEFSGTLLWNIVNEVQQELHKGISAYDKLEYSRNACRSNTPLLTPSGH